MLTVSLFTVVVVISSGIVTVVSLSGPVIDARLLHEVPFQYCTVIVELTTKPVAFTVIFAPLGPLSGMSVMLGNVTVKFVVL